MKNVAIRSELEAFLAGAGLVMHETDGNIPVQNLGGATECEALARRRWQTPYVIKSEIAETDLASNILADGTYTHS